jgi:hypothetical protein
MGLVLTEAVPVEGTTMLAYQPSLPLLRPHQARLRSVRRPFHPSRDTGPYRLPHDVRDILTGALAAFRNRDAAFALAVFLARFWSVPGRVEFSFPIDRRELANREDLGLSEDRIRGAIRTLERVGFLDRAIPPKGSKYQLTEAGELHRKAVLYAFGGDYAPSFMKANRRAQEAHRRALGERRPLSPNKAQQPAMSLPRAPSTNSPKDKERSGSQVIMGDLRKPVVSPPEPSEPNPKLEAALDRLLQGIRQSRGI